MTGWDGFAAGLGDVLGRLPADAVVQLYAADRPDEQCAQFWQDPDALHAEIGRDRVDLDWPAPASGYRDLARRVVDALRARGFATPADVTYRAWRAADSSDLPLPELGVAPVEVSYYARLRDGDPPTHPTGLLRRTRVGSRTTDEALGRDGRWRPTDTLVLAELGDVADDVRPITAATAAGVAARWGDEPGVRFAGPPMADRRPLPDDERGRVAAYLREAPIVVAGFGFDPDPFDPDGAEVVPLHLHTDGAWVWSASLGYFAERYGMAPEPDLLAHIEQRGYRWPELDRATLDRVSRLIAKRAGGG